MTGGRGYLNQADDEDQKYLLGIKLLWGFLPFVVRFLGIIISSVGTEQDFRPGGFPLEVGVSAPCHSRLVRLSLDGCRSV